MRPLPLPAGWRGANVGLTLKLEVRLELAQVGARIEAGTTDAEVLCCLARVAWTEA